MAKIQLDTETDFTPSALVDWLNNKYGNKDNGTAFNFQDVQQYTRRKKLPKIYGGHPLKWVENEQIGIKVIRINFNKP